MNNGQAHKINNMKNLRDLLSVKENKIIESLIKEIHSAQNSREIKRIKHHVGKIIENAIQREEIKNINENKIT
jgi:hypothetical protein